MGTINTGGGEAGTPFRGHLSLPRSDGSSFHKRIPARLAVLVSSPRTQPGSPEQYDSGDPLDRSLGGGIPPRSHPTPAIGWEGLSPSSQLPAQLTRSLTLPPCNTSSLGSQTPRCGSLCNGAGAEGCVPPCSRPPRHLGGCPHHIPDQEDAPAPGRPHVTASTCSVLGPVRPYWSDVSPRNHHALPSPVGASPPPALTSHTLRSHNLHRGHPSPRAHLKPPPTELHIPMIHTSSLPSGPSP